MSKGKLKIFFGYSAGVGKTYSMLKEGHKLLNEGHDVVLGYFEPHDREDTIKLTQGFETIEPLEFEYRGIKIKDFDVKSALIRHPEYILVDELAHTNTYNSRNRKRYLDVIELLNNGINVLTTVNVQHLESLYDLIDDKTNVEVTERIPDDIFQLADEIVIVDIEPKDLLDRMREGKIYKEERITKALSNFFKEENLVFLRELSMRKMADRIELQNNNGIKTTKVLVLISQSPSSQKNIRVAARMAQAFHAKFTALYVETNALLSDERAHTIKKYIDLVNNLNGEFVIKYSDDVVGTIANYVKLAGVTNVIIGKSWKSIGKKETFENKIISKLPNIEVLIVPDRDNIVNNERFNIFKNIFKRTHLEKFRLANTTLDIINKLNNSINLDEKHESIKTIVEILSRAFDRTIYLKVNEDEYICSFNNEDANIFNSEKEKTCIKYSLNFNTTTGKGTNTIRNAKGIYYPITYNNKAIAVIGILTINNKSSVTDRLKLEQIRSTISILINLLK